MDTTMAAQEQSAEQHSLAILDDYASIASPFFESISGLTVHSYPSTLSPSVPDELAKLVAQLHPYTIISTMRERTAFPASLLSQLPNLRLLLTTGARNASIDLSYCSTHSITVSGAAGTRPVYLTSSGLPIPSDPSNPSPPPPPSTVSIVHPIPSHLPSSTTQHTLSLLLSLTSRIPTDHAALTSAPYQAWQSGLTLPLASTTLSILGLGKLGTAFARLCHVSFGMRVLAWSESLTQPKADAAAQAVGLPPGTFTAVGSKAELFARADVLSVHYVLSPRSVGLVGAAELGAMKPGAVLVNTSRGPLVDEDALFEVLEAGRIRGAALDVFWNREPLGEESRWRRTRWGEDGRSRVVLSPHMGYVNERTMRCWYEEQRCDVLRWLGGREVGLRLA